MKETLTALLKQLGRAYEQSEIKQFSIDHGYEWYYSLVTTKMITGKPLIVGFNWGAAEGFSYEPQTKIEVRGFSDEDAGSLQRIKPFCSRYCDDEFLQSASQTNYCLFRSRKESEIKSGDIKLCEPIFERLVSVLEPSLLMCFSAKLRDYLVSTKKIANLQKMPIKFQSGAREVTYTAEKGHLARVPIMFLPHPNYPMKRDAREAAWEFCFPRN